MTDVAKACLECGERIVGRSDKKFCGDGCRNAFNNKNNSDATNLVRNINNALRKNRRILSELAPGEKAIVLKEKLLSRGFAFSYFTHVYQTKTGTIYHFCYEMGYLLLENDEVLIVKREKGI